MTDVSDTLQKRGQNYGEFRTHGAIAQGLKRLCRASPSWGKMASDQQEALDMIMHKVARIMNGNPNFVDSWHDIQGYAKLVEDRLTVDEQLRKDEIARGTEQMNAGVPGDG